MRPFLPLLSLAFVLCAAAADRRVAITLDDLPFAQSGPSACTDAILTKNTQRLLKVFVEQQVPVTAFVVGANCPELTKSQRRAILELWLKAGVTLGNHTYSHRSLNDTPIAEYEADILRADQQLRSVTGKPVAWFRSPFLATGNTLPVKRRLEEFLSTHGYRQAPVTIDNSDWLFANVYANALDQSDHDLANRVRSEYIPYLESVVRFFEDQSREVVGREIPQVLLLHANRLNADAMGDVLALFRRRGYRFVPLASATADAVYSSADSYVGRRGISWIRRWAVTQGLPDRAEPEDPQWLVEALQAIRNR